MSDKKEQDAHVLIQTRRSHIFMEAAIDNMLDTIGPIDTVEFLSFWIEQIMINSTQEDLEK